MSGATEMGPFGRRNRLSGQGRRPDDGPVPEETVPVTIELPRDEALVLFELLHRWG
jgi:hypothetical protein